MWYYIVGGVLLLLIIALFFLKRKMERIVDEKLGWRDFFIVFLAWIVFSGNKGEPHDDW